MNRSLLPLGTLLIFAPMAVAEDEPTAPVEESTESEAFWEDATFWGEALDHPETETYEVCEEDEDEVDPDDGAVAQSSPVWDWGQANGGHNKFLTNGTYTLHVAFIPHQATITLTGPGNTQDTWTVNHIPSTGALAWSSSFTSQPSNPGIVATHYCANGKMVKKFKPSGANTTAFHLLPVGQAWPRTDFIFDCDPHEGETGLGALDAGIQVMSSQEH
jgi:hypothetical protein